jgi:hypothetical protein
MSIVMTIWKSATLHFLLWKDFFFLCTNYAHIINIGYVGWVNVMRCSLRGYPSIIFDPKCCAMNFCQHFSHKNTLLLRQEFWGLSFEDHKTYGLDIPRRLHTKGNGRWQKFITIQGLDICKNVKYEIVSFSRSTYMLYKFDSKLGCQLLPHVNKDTHKLDISS